MRRSSGITWTELPNTQTPAAASQHPARLLCPITPPSVLLLSSTFPPQVLQITSSANYELKGQERRWSARAMEGRTSF